MAAKRRFTVEILGDASSLSRATARSQRDLDRLSAVAEDSSSGLLSLRSSAATAGAGVALLGGVAAKTGVQTAAGMEQAQIGFTTMLGSAERAKDFLDELADFAASTPFEFPDLVQASQKLLAMGVAAGDVIPYLTAIGDAVAALGGGKAEIDQVTLALGQMVAKGKVQGDELLQLTEVGIPALRILADSYGVTNEQMSQMVSAGTVLSEDAVPKLIQGLEKGTATTAGFGGMMAAQSQSLAGLWSTLKDTVNMALANMITPALPAIKTGLSTLTSVVSDVAPIIQNGLSTLGSSLSSVFSRLVGAVRSDAASAAGDVVDGVRQGIEHGDWASLGSAVGKGLAVALQGALDVSEQIFTGIGTAISKVPWFDLALELGKFVPTFFAGLIVGIANFDLGSLFKGIGDHLFETVIGVLTLAFLPVKLVGVISRVLGKVPFAGPLLKWAFEALVSFSKGLVGKVGDALGFLGRAFSDGFARIFPGIGAALGNWLKLLPTRLGVAGLEILSAAKGMIGKLAEGIASGAGQVAAKLGEIVGVIVKAFIGAHLWLIPSGVALVAGFVKGVGSLIGAVASKAAHVISAVTRPFTAAGSWLISKGAEAVRGLINGIGSVISSVTVIAGHVITAVTKPFGAASSWLVSAGSKVISGLGSGISGAIGGVTSLIAGIGGKVTGAVGDAASWLFNAGKAIIQGLINGITSMAGSVKNAVSNVLSKARDLLPFSPAKEGPFSGHGWTLYSGRAISEALAQGVTDRQKLVADAVDKLVRTASVPLAQPFTPPKVMPAAAVSQPVSNTVTVNASTNADPRTIANEVAWLLKTAGR